MFWDGSYMKARGHYLRHVVDMTKLRNIQIKRIGIQNEESKILEELRKENDVSSYSLLELIFGQDRCDVQFKDINIATINTKTYSALKSLLNERIRYKALVPQAEFRRKLDTTVHSPGANRSELTWSMDIQIFGISSIADTVAKELSKYRLFLQHPHPMPVDVAYENPQYLSMAGSSFTNGAILPPISTEMSQVESKSNPDSELDHVPNELIAIINNLPRHEYLQEADVDKRIKTKLLRQVYRANSELGKY